MTTNAEVLHGNRATATHNRWLDGTKFAKKTLLKSGEIPCMNSTGTASLFGQLEGVLSADALTLPLMEVLTTWLQANPQALMDMSGKKRVRYAVKKLLTHPVFRHDLKELLSSIGGVVRGEIFVVLPGNSEVTRWAHTQANPDAEFFDMTELDVDSVSVYLADLVREFKECGVTAVIASVGNEDMAAGARPELYQPIANVAEHYQWSFGCLLNTEADDAPFKDGADIVVSLGSAANVAVLGNAFWQDGVLPEPAAVIYSQVPVELAPEQIRKHIASLKQQFVAWA